MCVALVYDVCASIKTDVDGCIEPDVCIYTIHIHKTHPFLQQSNRCYAAPGSGFSSRRRPAPTNSATARYDTPRNTCIMKLQVEFDPSTTTPINAPRKHNPTTHTRTQNGRQASSVTWCGTCAPSPTTSRPSARTSCAAGPWSRYVGVFVCVGGVFVCVSMVCGFWFIPTYTCTHISDAMPHTHHIYTGDRPRLGGGAAEALQGGVPHPGAQEQPLPGAWTDEVWIHVTVHGRGMDVIDYHHSLTTTTTVNSTQTNTIQPHPNTNTTTNRWARRSSASP